MHTSFNPKQLPLLYGLTLLLSHVIRLSDGAHQINTMVLWHSGVCTISGCCAIMEKKTMHQRDRRCRHPNTVPALQLHALKQKVKPTPVVITPVQTPPAPVQVSGLSVSAPPPVSAAPQ